MLVSNKDLFKTDFLLNVGDKIQFNGFDHVYDVNKSFLNIRDHDNDLIFKFLGEYLSQSKRTLCTNVYGYNPHSGRFPAYEKGDMKAATNIARELQALCLIKSENILGTRVLSIDGLRSLPIDSIEDFIIRLPFDIYYRINKFGTTERLNYLYTKEFRGQKLINIQDFNCPLEAREYFINLAKSLETSRKIIKNPEEEILSVPRNFALPGNKFAGMHINFDDYIQFTDLDGYYIMKENFLAREHGSNEMIFNHVEKYFTDNRYDFFSRVYGYPVNRGKIYPEYKINDQAAAIKGIIELEALCLIKQMHESGIPLVKSENLAQLTTANIVHKIIQFSHNIYYYVDEYCYLRPLNHYFADTIFGFSLRKGSFVSLQDVKDYLINLNKILTSNSLTEQTIKTTKNIFNYDPDQLQRKKTSISSGERPTGTSIHGRRSKTTTSFGSLSYKTIIV